MADKFFGLVSNPSLPDGSGLVNNAGHVSPRFMTYVYHDFFTSFDLLPFSVFEEAGRFAPGIMVLRNPNAVMVTADLPGIQADDIELALFRDKLVISGNVNVESSRNVPFSESFRKTVPIPFPVDLCEIKATFQNGILQVIIPIQKNHPGNRVRIPIKKI